MTNSFRSIIQSKLDTLNTRTNTQLRFELYQWNGKRGINKLTKAALVKAIMLATYGSKLMAEFAA